MWLGIDTGGTFTDFVLYDGERLRTHKRLSTPQAPEQAILAGIEDLGLDPARLTLIHGSTVATNAALEGKGVRTVFITNHGLGDMLTLGRQARRELYDLQPPPVQPPVPPEACLETGGRLGADGSEIEPLGAADIGRLVQRVTALAPEAVAINLLFSFLDDRHERAIEAALPPHIFISRSSAVLPEYREYERGIATWLNAWVGPLVQCYLSRLRTALPQAHIAVMQSAGTTVTAEQAGRLAVHMLLSGPAGGLNGARRMAALGGCDKLLTFDMGGTSTDVALIDGDIRLTREGRIGPYPVGIPMVDMHTIGAGGGSLAYVDAGGMLQVGPESAGADPGPACYGRGGAGATVTDANLVLGRLRPKAFLGGAMTLDGEAARVAVNRIARRLECGLEEAALGIIRIANEHMAQALRVISVQRGVDPRNYTLLSFGGAGGLHVCALAEALDMQRALAPAHAGVLSALGMLAAPRGRELSRTIPAACHALHEQFMALERQGRLVLQEEGIAAETIQARWSLDMRYRGQGYTLNLPWQPTGMEEAFHAAHHQRYGHCLDLAVESVNVRVRLEAPPAPLPLPRHAPCAGTPGSARLYGIEDEVPVWQRRHLQPGQVVAGPAVVIDPAATLYIANAWRGRLDDYGNLHLTRLG